FDWSPMRGTESSPTRGWSTPESFSRQPAAFVKTLRYVRFERARVGSTPTWENAPPELSLKSVSAFAVDSEVIDSKILHEVDGVEGGTARQPVGMSLM